MATASGAIPPHALTRHGAAAAVLAAWRGDGVLRRAFAPILVVAIVIAAVLWWDAAGPALVIGPAVSLVVLTAAALVDLAERRLPNTLVLAAAVPVAIVVAAPGAPGGDPTAALAGAAMCGGPLLATHLVAPAGLGFGDVKAGAVVGGALGVISPVIAVTALLLALMATAVAGLTTGRRHLPFGPGLVIGATTALVLTRWLGVTPW